MNHLEDRVQHLLTNNLQWKLPHHFPVTIQEQDNRLLASIHFYPISQRPKFFIEIIDPTKSYKIKHQSMYPASEIQVSPRLLYLSDRVIDLILLHELCHWYTLEEYYPLHTQDHGAEFQKSARKIKLPKEYARAKAPDDCYSDAKNPLEFHNTAPKPKPKTVYLGLCSKCNALVLRSTKRSDVIPYLNTPNALSNCCKAPVISGGKST